MERPEIIEGLELEFAQYSAIVDLWHDNIMAVPIPYRPDIAADKVAAAIKSMPQDVSAQEFKAKVRDAGEKRITERSRQLIKHGFVGTLNQLFDRVIEIQGVDEEPSDQLMEELTAEATKYRNIPEERRKGAKVTDGGYYWAGKFNAFDK